MAYYSRSAWTSTGKGGTRLAGSGRTMTTIYIHYPGQGAAIGRASTASTRNRLEGYRRQHKNVNGWADIAYNVAVDQSGNVWELRGIDRQSGANGGTASNRSGQAILVLVGNNEKPTAECIAGIKDAIRRIRAQHPQATTIRGHQQSPDASTACPGARLMALVRNGGLEPGKGSVSPSKPSDPGRPWLTSPRVSSMSKADVKAIQAELAGAGYPLGSHGVDGSYGDATGAAVKQLQTDLGLEADGIYGPGTEKALMTLKKDIDWVRRVVEENQKRITDARAEIDWVRRVAEANQRRIDRNERRVSSITRGGKEVSLRQEIADAKTFAMANAAQIKSLSALLAEADVDTTEAKVPDKAEG